MQLDPGLLIHRVGGATLANLRLSSLELKLLPPGISVLAGGTPQEAAEAMRNAFPQSRKWQTAAKIVATSTVAEIQSAGFDVIPDPTILFPNHCRLIHSSGESGFADDNLKALLLQFRDTEDC